MFKVNYNPDVLSCLANLSNDEVFTPPKLVNEILDLLPEELWSDKSITFLDPFTKSGVFLREIAKRLLEGLEKEIPDQQERINHIFTKQIFGIAITELTSLLARRSVYCSKTANGKYSIVEGFDNAQGNIKYDRIEHTWKNGKCIFCGASQSEYDREDVLESYAYQFIHTEKPENIFNMKFDVIVGNPPYQLSDGGHGKSAKPLYHKFVTQAKKLNPRYLIMIIPSRWYAGGKGLRDFRNEMLNDRRISKLVDFKNSKDCFPSGVDIPGGICYFLWEKEYSGDCHIINVNSGKIRASKRALNEFSTFIRDSDAIPIIKKVLSQKNVLMNDVVSSRKPFGIATNERPLKKGELTLIWSKGSGVYPRNKVSVGIDLIDKWKVIVSKVAYEHAGQPDKHGKMRVLSRIEVLPPETICTETYLVAGSFDSKIHAENLLSFLKCKLPRFLISQLLISQDVTKERFIFVPFLNMDENWSDEKLYKKFSITNSEQAFIDSLIHPME